MKTKIQQLTIILLLFSFFTSVNGQNQNDNREYTEREKNTIVKDFLETVDETRDRLNRLQERAPLKELPYQEEAELVREAEQMEKLIDEGHYVSPSKLREMEKSLKKIGNGDEPPEGEVRNASQRWERSIERSENIMRRGDETVNRSRERLTAAREKMREDRSAGKLTEAEFKEKEEKIRQVEQRINDLEMKIREERRKVDSLKRRIDNKN